MGKRSDGMGGAMPKGGGTDNPNIGEKGNMKGGSSRKGGHIPFLPNTDTYGGHGRSKASGSTTGKTTTGKRIPFLPNKPE